MSIRPPRVHEASVTAGCQRLHFSTFSSMRCVGFLSCSPVLSQHICGCACQACMLNSSECRHVSSFQSITLSMCISLAPRWPPTTAQGVQVCLCVSLCVFVCVARRLCVFFYAKSILPAHYTALDLQSSLLFLQKVGRVLRKKSIITNHFLTLGLPITTASIKVIIWMRHLKKKFPVSYNLGLIFRFLNISGQ